MLPCFALAAPPALTTQVPREARPKEPVRIVIDTDRRTLGVYSGKTLYRTFPIAVGKPSTPTPLGNWQISEKAIWGGAFGTRWLRLSVPYGIYGVHGTNNPGSIGSFASHGCVRMFNRDVEQVYAWVQEGTPVDIVGTPPRRVIVEGSRGSEVSDVQRALAALGLYKGPHSGVFTAQLTQAVTEFQKGRNLRADGIVRRDTYTALGLYPPRRLDPPWLEQASPPKGGGTERLRSVPVPAAAGDLSDDHGPRPTGLPAHVDVHTKRLAEAAAVQHLGLRASGEDPAVLDQQRVREDRQDLLDVVRDVDERRTLALRTQLPQGREHAFARSQVQACAGFVQDQKFGLGHPHATEQNTLLLALRQRSKRPCREVRAAKGRKDAQGPALVLCGGPVPEADHGVAPAHHDLQRRLVRADRGEVAADGRCDPADAPAVLAQVGSAVLRAEHRNLACPGPEVAVYDVEERRLARAVLPDDRPMLAPLHAPMQIPQYRASLAPIFDPCEFDHR